MRKYYELAYPDNYHVIIIRILLYWILHIMLVPVLSQDLEFLRDMSGSEPGHGFPTRYVGVWARTWMSYAVCRGLNQDLDFLRGMSRSEPGPGCPTRYVVVWARTWMSYAVCRGLSQDLDVLRSRSGSEPGPGCPTRYVGVFVVFNGLRWEVVIRVWWYWWNCWPLLFKLSFHNSLVPSLIINVVCILHVYRDLHFSIYQNK